MQTRSIKKLSILGLVLMGASAVTAAVLPNNTDENLLDNGSLTGNGTSKVTCSQTNQINAQGCTASSIGSGTVTTIDDEDNPVVSNDSVSSASGDGGAGQNNTTD